MSGTTHNCAGMRRRDFIQVGLGGLMGLGLADLLRLQAKTVSVPGAAAAAANAASGKPVNCILIWLDGGPSHYETFDPKPDAPSEIRGQFGTIPTAVPGTRFCEAIPELAKVADKFTVLRSICHKDPNHGGGNHYLMTGSPTPVPVACGAFVTFHPSFGSVVAWKRGQHEGLPPYVSMPSVTRSGGPNFLGGNCAPFVIDGQPNAADFRVRDVVLPSEISAGRAASRRALRTSLDGMKRYADRLAEDPAVTFDQYLQQGVDLVMSSKAQAAFDLQREDAKLREQYGRNDFAQRLLMARRLVEVGVSWVTVNYGGWDHHGELLNTEAGMLATLDEAIGAYQRALERIGNRGTRHAICHNTMVHPDDIARYRQLGLIANATPLWGTDYDGIHRASYERRIGSKRIEERLLPYGDLQRAGVIVSYGADIPGVDLPEIAPLIQIEAAVTRKRPGFPNDIPLVPRQRVTVSEAIRNATWNGAYQLRLEDRIGSIEVGKLADLVVLGDDLIEIPPERIHDVRVLLTMMDGRITHDALDDRPPAGDSGSDAPPIR